MTERENFLERWSRKKREAVDEPAPSKKPQDAEAEKRPEAAQSALGAEPREPFDLENLPSLKSITAETDIRDFLQPSVPVDLKREALRRAWSADPGIRDFVGLAENSWDFNDPTAMAGFGPIEPSEVARLMAQFALTPPPEDDKKGAQKVAEADNKPDNKPESEPSATFDAADDKAVANAPANVAEVATRAEVDAASQKETDAPQPTDPRDEPKA